MYTKKNIQASFMSNTYLVLSLNKTFRLNDGALHHSLPSIHSNNRQTVTKTISCLFSIFIMFVWISCRIHLFQTSIRGVSFNVFIQFILHFKFKKSQLSHIMVNVLKRNILKKTENNYEMIACQWYEIIQSIQETWSTFLSYLSPTVTKYCFQISDFLLLISNTFLKIYMWNTQTFIVLSFIFVAIRLIFQFPVS